MPLDPLALAWIALFLACLKTINLPSSLLWPLDHIVKMDGAFNRSTLLLSRRLCACLTLQLVFPSIKGING